MTKRLKQTKEATLIEVAAAVAGATAGAVAGPPGIVTGAIIGGAIGAVVGHTLDDEERRVSLHDQELDREIGVTEGDLGAASPTQPAARIGAFSSASAGASNATESPSEGPMQNVDDDT